MEQIRPLLIKYIYTAAITILILTYLLVPSVALGSSLIIALFITLVLYYAGDRFLLPRFGTVATAIANFVLAAIVLAVANGFVREPITTGSILTAAVVIGVAEWFFYRYARSEVSPATAGGDITSFAEFLGEDNPGETGTEPTGGGEAQGAGENQENQGGNDNAGENPEQQQ
ncbi:MAG: DUF2512 family protein [Bacillota bacterium]